MKFCKAVFSGPLCAERRKLVQIFAHVKEFTEEPVTSSALVSLNQITRLSALFTEHVCVAVGLENPRACLIIADPFLFRPLSCDQG